jgi:hypothetical protein
MRMWRSSMCLVFVLAACGTAKAQEAGQVGITMGFPASVGVIFHATDKVAVRPEFTFTRSSTDSGPIHASAWSIGTGVSALFYLGSFDRVHPYVSPRFSYTRSSSSAEGSAISSTTSNGTGVFGSFGAQYSPSAKFSVFGETGFGYTSNSSKSDASGIELKNHTWGTRAGVGVIFYP